MGTTGKFSIEQLEQIRLLVGERLTAVKGTVNNINADPRVNESKRARRLVELSMERKELEGINETAVRLINEIFGNEES